MENKKPDIKELKEKAIEIRKDILTMLNAAGSGHTGGSLSMVEILITLYGYAMRHNPKKPDWPDRDKLILSKGHGCPALYTVLAHYGYFPKEELMTLRKLGSRLQGHPQRGLPGIETASGSLGQGLSISNGLALAARLDKRNTRIYCIMGDGELNEGQIWEAVMTASQYKLDNICGIVDHNKYCIDGLLKDIKCMDPLPEKWSSFGWNTIDIDGHSFKDLMSAFDKAKTLKGKPTVIIAHTIKGKGISFIECQNRWHGTTPKKDELERALKELDEERRKI
ncbi:MAG: transketolase [Candidatus Omnitrophica bacterium CG07_land_8_20_14_0_80_42_15]|uniref:Transketolase n=1 Tax=Candidatus Aquitaenariimonas noxiae TaxID=1974741 RepID=A0A2J0KWV3_9BACT|nr:MAG: transketolase [Candidatus Omnitrophica bacterium CG07_land_8_20_14_0_80_42_15]